MSAPPPPPPPPFPSLPPEEIAFLQSQNDGPKSVAVVVAFTIIAFVCVVLRVVTRVIFTRNIGWEDYFIIFSMCCSIIMAACQIEQALWGLGRHMMFLSLEQGEMILKYLYFSILAYCGSLTFTKLSILLQYCKIFTAKNMRLQIYIVMGIVVACSTEATIVNIFACVPVHAFWKPLEKPFAKCIDQNVLYFVNAALNVLTDLLVAVLPIKALWHLKIPQRQKIALVIIFTLGWFVCVVSMVRIQALNALMQHPEDTTWYGTASAYWSAVEVNVGIVCASTPALKPLVARVIPQFMSSLGSKNSQSRGTGASDPTSNGSFIELKGKSSSATMDDDDLERGERPITALPPRAARGKGRNLDIKITKEVEQYSKNIHR